MIYLDMDGVLADFDGGLAENGVVNCKTFMHLPKDQWTEEQTALSKQVFKLMSTSGFFRGLPPMQGYRDLWKACESYGHKVLTAAPGEPISSSRVSQEKQDWLLWHIGEFSPEDFICCLRTEKKKYSTGDGTYMGGKPNILIDDMESNCSAWEEAGGKAILFKSAEQSITELKKLVG